MITVFYEDSLADGSIRNFGPHLLALQCVVDRRSTGNAYELQQLVVANPKNGNTKVRRALHVDAPILAGSGSVIGVLDSDRAHECYGQPVGACRTELLAAIRAEAATVAAIVLLETSIETVVRACCLALQLPQPGRKNRAERDHVLHAAKDAANPLVRSEVLAAVPSFDRLVRVIDRQLGDVPELSAP